MIVAVVLALLGIWLALFGERTLRRRLAFGRLKAVLERGTAWEVESVVLDLGGTFDHVVHLDSSYPYEVDVNFRDGGSTSRQDSLDEAARTALECALPAKWRPK